MSSITITVPETSDTEAKVAAVVVRAKAMSVVDAASHAEAGEFVRGLAAFKASVEAELAPAIEAAHRSHKAMTTLRAKLTAPIDEARSIVGPKMIDWTQAEQRRLDAERRRAEEAARKAAEEAMAEERRRIEADRKAAEEAQIEAALEAEAMGQTDIADSILSEPAYVEPAPVVPVAVYIPPVAAPKVEGVSTRTTYRAEVVDLMAMVRHVAAHPSDVAYLTANTTALNGMARAHKETLKIPGVRVVAEQSLSVRS